VRHPAVVHPRRTAGLANSRLGRMVGSPFPRPIREHSALGPTHRQTGTRLEFFGVYNINGSRMDRAFGDHSPTFRLTNKGRIWYSIHREKNLSPRAIEPPVISHCSIDATLHFPLPIGRGEKCRIVKSVDATFDENHLTPPSSLFYTLMRQHDNDATF